jgi:N-acetyl-anhydromuramyl-L-alanine amidase AmpD
VKRLMSICVLLLLWLLQTAGSYTDADIQRMKERYEGRAFPREFWKRPYQEPRLVEWMLPYQDWEEEYRRYFWVNYRDARLTFVPRPTAIVMHYTAVDSALAVYKGFVRGARMSHGDSGLVFGHPSVHLMIDRDGTIYQLLPLDRRATGAYGVNHVALQIEMVAANEAQLLARKEMIWSSFCLVRYLMREYQIPLSKVYAHYEVSIGRSLVPEYTAANDTQYPDGYPAENARTDPGTTYMSWLRTYLLKTGPAPPAGR